MDVVIENLTCRFGRTLAVDNVSFSLPAGCVTGLVGPNGAGKTTLLRMMAGYVQPDNGDIRYDGVSVVDYPEKTAFRVALMSDTLPAAREWRVRDYLEFYGRANGLEGASLRERMAEVYRLCTLDPIADKRLNAISKGMKQRVALARILLVAPPLLLLDEPAAGLDPRVRVDLRNIVRDLAEKGHALLVSSHILAELEDMCDEVLIMEHGRKVRHGTLRQLENEPQGSSCTVVLEFSEVDDALRTRLAALPGSPRLTFENRRKVLAELPDRTAADSFMAALFAAHLPLAVYHASNVTLESIFIESTGNNLQ